MAGVLISDSGYAADAKVLAKSAKNTGMLGAIANHNKPSGGWAVSGKSAIWSKTGLLASADDTSDALVVATSANGIWKGSVIHL